MRNKIILLFVLISCVQLFAQETHDISISEKLFNIYKEDITPKELDLILEFDEYNSEALHIKALYLEAMGKSLNEPLSLMKKTKLNTIQSKYYYIYLLYKLGKYSEIVDFIYLFDYETIKDKKIIFYIADSLYREEHFDKSRDLINKSIYKYPDYMLFYEIRYLIDKDRESLTKIWLAKDSLQFLVRLHGRLSRSNYDSVVELLLLYKIKKTNIKDLQNTTLNYSIVNLLDKNIKRELFNGIYTIDTNLDTFSDSLVVLEKGQVVFKQIDLDGDSIVDVEFSFKDKLLDKIKVDSTLLEYSHYPIVKRITFSGTYLKEYDFYFNEVKFIYNSFFNEFSSIDFKKIVNSGKLHTIKHYYEKDLIAEYNFLDKNTIKVSLEKNLNDSWNYLLLIKDNKVNSGVRDLDSDGTFDLLEFYKLETDNKITYILDNELVNNKVKYYYPEELPELKIINSVEMFKMSNKELQIHKWWKQ